jgi:hypothetical protein
MLPLPPSQLLPELVAANFLNMSLFLLAWLPADLEILKDTCRQLL